MIQTILAVAVVVVAVPLNWYVTFRLWRLSKANPEIRVLGERTFTALALAVIITIFAGVFLNNGMEVPLLDLPATQLVTRSAILALTIPPLFWLWLYRKRGR